MMFMRFSVIATEWSSGLHQLPTITKILLLFALSGAFNSGATANDRVREKLNLAKEEYVSSLTTHISDVEAWFKKQKQAVQNIRKPNPDLLDQLTIELSDFEEFGVLPIRAPEKMRDSPLFAIAKLTKAFETAIDTYQRQREFDSVKEVTAEYNQFRDYGYQLGERFAPFPVGSKTDGDITKIMLNRIRGKALPIRDGSVILTSMMRLEKAVRTGDKLNVTVLVEKDEQLIHYFQLVGTTARYHPKGASARTYTVDEPNYRDRCRSPGTLTFEVTLFPSSSN